MRPPFDQRLEVQPSKQMRLLHWRRISTICLRYDILQQQRLQRTTNNRILLRSGRCTTAPVHAPVYMVLAVTKWLTHLGREARDPNVESEWHAWNAAYADSTHPSSCRACTVGVYHYNAHNREVFYSRFLSAPLCFNYSSGSGVAFRSRSSESGTRTGGVPLLFLLFFLPLSEPVLNGPNLPK